MLYVTQIEKDLSKSYTQAALSWMRSLQTQNINFEFTPLSAGVFWDEAPEWARGSKEYFTKTRSDRSVALVHLQPADLLRVPYKNKELSIGVTTFETTKLPLWIAEGLNENYRGLIVPSKYNKQSLIDSKVTIPIEVVDHAVGDWWWETPALTNLQKDPNLYVFGYVGAWNNRKNPEAILKAYLQTFPTEQKEFALLIKTRAPVGVDGYIEHLLKDFGGSRDDIWIYNEIWGEDQMFWAYQYIDCYVSAHKGEGFGLGLAQAAVLGKPVIYTNYSAPVEWLHSPQHFPVEYTLEHAGNMNENLHLHFKETSDMMWAEPSFDDLCKKMLYVSQNKPKVGFSGNELLDFRQRLSWESVGKQLVNAVESITKTPLQRIE